MPGDPRIRASDKDRERTAALLREHHAQGRLTPEEFNDRVDRTFAATTIGDLDALLADLPAIDLYRLPAAGIRPAPPGALRPRGSAVDQRGQGAISPRGAAAWAAWAARVGIRQWRSTNGARLWDFRTCRAMSAADN